MVSNRVSRLAPCTKWVAVFRIRICAVEADRRQVQHYPIIQENNICVFPLANFNMSTTGVWLEHMGQRITIRLKYGATLMDEDAIRSLRSVRGHAGNKPCCSCQNIIGRVGPYPDFHDPYLVHVLSPESDRFIHHTAETFKVCVNKISDAVREGRPHSHLEKYTVSTMWRTGSFSTITA